MITNNDTIDTKEPETTNFIKKSFFIIVAKRAANIDDNNINKDIFKKIIDYKVYYLFFFPNFFLSFSVKYFFLNLKFKGVTSTNSSSSI